MQNGGRCYAIWVIRASTHVHILPTSKSQVAGTTSFLQRKTLHLRIRPSSVSAQAYTHERIYYPNGFNKGEKKENQSHSQILLAEPRWSPSGKTSTPYDSCTVIIYAYRVKQQDESAQCSRMALCVMRNILCIPEGVEKPRKIWRTSVDRLFGRRSPQLISIKAEGFPIKWQTGMVPVGDCMIDESSEFSRRWPQNMLLMNHRTQVHFLSAGAWFGCLSVCSDEAWELTLKVTKTIRISC